MNIGDRVKFNGTGSMDALSKSQYTVGVYYYVVDFDCSSVSVSCDVRPHWTMGEDEFEESFDLSDEFSYDVRCIRKFYDFTAGHTYKVSMLSKKVATIMDDVDFLMSVSLSAYYIYFKSSIRTIKVYGDE